MRSMRTWLWPETTVGGAQPQAQTCLPWLEDNNTKQPSNRSTQLSL